MKLSRSTTLFGSIFALQALLPSAFAREDAPIIKEEPGIIVSSDLAHLNARWTLPESAPRSVVVLIQGSGNVGLDGDVSSPLIGSGYKGAPAKLSDQLAAALASVGVASLRYSKRGVDDPKELPNQTLPFLVQDAKAAVKLATERFPRQKIALIGFSEGALVASIVAADKKFDALFLLGLPSRPIDEVLTYQFRQWPVELLRRLDLNHDGEISSEEQTLLKAGETVPLLGTGLSPTTWQELDRDKSGTVSLIDEIIPACQKSHETVTALLGTPAFASWISEMRKAPRFKKVASKITVPVYLYHGLQDAQVYWGWVDYDRRFFSGKNKLRLYADLGHCFAPMDGSIGQIKTSGPFDNRLIKDILGDVQSSL